MKDKPKITRMEIHKFDYRVKDLAMLPGHTVFAYEPGATTTFKAHALKIITDEGATGEYVGSWAATDWMAIPEYGQILIGRNGSPGPIQAPRVQCSGRRRNVLFFPT